MSAADSYPRLRLLMAGYLHEDWHEESGSPEEAVRLFATREGPGVAREAAEEVDDALASLSGRGEAAASALLRDLGGAYDAEADGWTATEWLARVRALLRGQG